MDLDYASFRKGLGAVLKDCPDGFMAGFADSFRIFGKVALAIPSAIKSAVLVESRLGEASDATDVPASEGGMKIRIVGAGQERTVAVDPGRAVAIMRTLNLVLDQCLDPAELKDATFTQTGQINPSLATGATVEGTYAKAATGAPSSTLPGDEGAPGPPSQR